ncbi:hypothetical protein BC826DRAFT_51251 [Russula brevipes]|nr:hypothetical protein BC826DRAFT_51251 [Russula brevipes]
MHHASRVTHHPPPPPPPLRANGKFKCSLHRCSVAFYKVPQTPRDNSIRCSCLWRRSARAHPCTCTCITVQSGQSSIEWAGKDPFFLSENKQTQPTARGYCKTAVAFRLHPQSNKNKTSRSRSREGHSSRKKEKFPHTHPFNSPCSGRRITRKNLPTLHSPRPFCAVRINPSLVPLAVHEGQVQWECPFEFRRRVLYHYHSYHIRQGT